MHDSRDSDEEEGFLLVIDDRVDRGRRYGVLRLQQVDLNGGILQFDLSDADSRALIFQK